MAHWFWLDVSPGDEDGSAGFADPQAAQLPARFYRLIRPWRAMPNLERPLPIINIRLGV